MSEKRLIVPYLCCLVLFFYEVFFGIFQLLESSFVYANGSFINSGPFSCFLAVLIPLFIRVYQWGINKYIKYICGVAILVGILFIPYQLSRTAILSGMIGSLFVIVLPYVNSKCIFRHKRLIVSLSAIAAVSCIIFLVFIKFDSANGRLFIWRIALNYIIHDMPWIGVTWRGVPCTYAEQQELYFRDATPSEYEMLLADTPNYLFNEFLSVWMAFGTLGLIILLTCFVFVLVTCYRQRFYGLFGFVISLSIVMFFSYPLHCVEFWLVLIFLFLGFLFSKVSAPIRIVSSIFLVICFYAAYDNYTFPQRQDLGFKIAVDLFRSGEFEMSNKLLFEEVYPYSPDVRVLYLIAQNYQGQGNSEECKSFLRKSIVRVPHKLYPHYKLMQVCIAENNLDEAYMEAEYLVNRKPKVDSPATQQMRIEALRFMYFND